MNRTTLILLILASAGAMHAQGKKYIKTMKHHLAALDSAKEDKQFVSCALAFKKMKQQKSDWLVNYYTALSYLRACFTEKQEGIEELCDTAEVYVNKADSLSKDNAEIYILKSMLATGRLIADPMGRWMSQGKKSYDALEKAKALDPANPRPYVIKGQSLYFTPGGMGGCGKAMAQIDIAREKFKTYKAASELHPQWGKQIVDDVTNECNKEK